MSNCIICIWYGGAPFNINYIVSCFSNGTGKLYIIKSKNPWPFNLASNPCGPNKVFPNNPQQIFIQNTGNPLYEYLITYAWAYSLRHLMVKYVSYKNIQFLMHQMGDIS